MPDYRVTFTFTDDSNGITTRTYNGVFNDFPTANAAASNLETDIDAITDAAIIKKEVAEVTNISANPAAGSLVFNSVQATVNTVSAGQKLATVTIPAVNSGIMSGNNLVAGSQAWTDFTDNFASNLWTISDGEPIVDTLRGKRVIQRSGKSNLR